MALLFHMPVRDSHAQQGTPIPENIPGSMAVLSPLPGQALQGSVPISVNTNIEGFISVEIEFSYFNNPTDTWFFIHQSDQPLSNEIITTWDTSLISDGAYTLRMIVSLSDGSQQMVTVPGLRVRNYTSIETDTPAPITPTETHPLEDIVETTITPPGTEQPHLTPTPLPPNPAEISRDDVLINAGKGALTVIGLFTLGIIYVTVRSFTKK